MALTPDWAPNIHPIVVHFPIALLTTAFVVDLLGLFMHTRTTVRDTATWLYCAGAALAILAYFTGRSGADAMLLPTQVNSLVNEHSDWAFRTTWFFAFFASARLALSYLLTPKLLLLGISFAVATAGFVMLIETAEHGAMLVFQHGLGVQAITKDEPVTRLTTAVNNNQTNLGIAYLDNGSWLWRPTRGAETIFSDQFTWLVNDVSHVAPTIVEDPARGPVLGLHPKEIPVIFVAGEQLEATEAEVNLNIDAFDGILRLIYHVKDQETFDFLSVTSDVVAIGRTNDGILTVFDQKPLADTGWLTLRVFGGDGHFRGYVNGELIAHGHADDLDAGPFGFLIEGTGTILVESIQVKAAN
jgi:uncharacterized membrane protein